MTLYDPLYQRIVLYKKNSFASTNFHLFQNKRRRATLFLQTPTNRPALHRAQQRSRGRGVLGSDCEKGWLITNPPYAKQIAKRCV